VYLGSFCHKLLQTQSDVQVLEKKLCRHENHIYREEVNRPDPSAQLKPHSFTISTDARTRKLFTQVRRSTQLHADGTTSSPTQNIELPNVISSWVSNTVGDQLKQAATADEPMCMKIAASEPAIIAFRCTIHQRFFRRHHAGISSYPPTNTSLDHKVDKSYSRLCL
jgi:hypothetical protein